MTFREGLLKARGQIAFIIALVLSTAVIMYLEGLDTEERIQSRVSAELARQSETSVSPPLRTAVTTGMRRAQEAYEHEPDAAANQGSLLTFVASAVQLGIIGSAEGLSQVEKILDRLEQKSGEHHATLASALSVTAATFPALQDRISSRLSEP